MSERKTAEEMAREELGAPWEERWHDHAAFADIVRLMERYAAQEVAAAQALWARVAADTSRPVYAEAEPLPFTSKEAASMVVVPLPDAAASAAILAAEAWARMRAGSGCTAPGIDDFMSAMLDYQKARADEEARGIGVPPEKGRIDSGAIYRRMLEWRAVGIEPTRIFLGPEFALRYWGIQAVSLPFIKRPVYLRGKSSFGAERASEPVVEEESLLIVPCCYQGGVSVLPDACDCPVAPEHRHLEEPLP